MTETKGWATLQRNDMDRFFQDHAEWDEDHQEDGSIVFRYWCKHCFPFQPFHFKPNTTLGELVHHFNTNHPEVKLG